MDTERIIKRLAIMLAVSLVVIFVAKMLLGKAVTNLGKASEAKQQANAKPVEPQPIPEPTAANQETEVSAASAVPASAVPPAENPAIAQ